jgi:hypothetical protein
MSLDSAPTLEATATIATDQPSRYLLQLCKHLRGKVPVEFDDSHGAITVGAGSCTLDALDGALVVHVTGTDPESIAQLESIVARHLKKFDRHDSLVIEWS